MKKRYWILGAFAAAVYIANASWIAGVPDGEMSLAAHRGVYQTFSTESLTQDSCTAESINRPTHNLLENTLPSMQAALDAGADFVEIDIHPTSDGEFVVFHDWTLDCRTDGTGKTRDHSLAELMALDIGYGYTADGGQTYPFRGQFVGAMPMLSEVLTKFPNAKFIINIKSRSASEAEALLTYVKAADWARLSLMSHPTPASVIRNSHPDMSIQSKPDVKACVKGYLLTGWFGRVPDTCQNSYIAVPAKYRRLIWGWPHRFEKRLHKVGSRSLLMGDFLQGGSPGIDSVDDIKYIPEDYKGMVWTNKIEVIGPELKPN